MPSSSLHCRSKADTNQDDSGGPLRRGENSRPVEPSRKSLCNAGDDGEPTCRYAGIDGAKRKGSPEDRNRVRNNLRDDGDVKQPRLRVEHIAEIPSKECSAKGARGLTELRSQFRPFVLPREPRASHGLDAEDDQIRSAQQFDRLVKGA